MSPHIPASRPGTPSLDPAFKIVPRGYTAFLIWRIEKLQVVPVPKEQYGSFFNGDSYIVYSASDNFERPGMNTKTRELRRHGDLRVHFWLGENTSQDEAGVAAIKSVELDDFLDGSPVQHREVQGAESERFKSYFPAGIRYLEGGVESGLKPLDTTFKPKLLHIKGKRRPVIRQIPEISWKLMNDNDVFVLDTETFIFVWIGKNANIYEKHQGSKVAQKLKSERGGGDVVTVDDGKEHLLPMDEKTAFSQYLDIQKIKLGKVVQDAVNSDIVHERVSAEQLRLYRCSDAEGVLKITEVKGGPLLQTDLNSDDSFIVDNRSNGIWVWIGKNATKTERSEAMRNAQGFINKKGYPNGTPIVRVIDGGEPIEFRALFKVWHEKDETLRPRWIDRSFNKIAPTVQTKFDAASLHEKQSLAAHYQMVDDGSGRRDIWRVVNFDLVPLDPKEYGTFYAGDCYVILYTYRNSFRECHIIYIWQGRKSTTDEKGTAAAKAVEMDTRMGGGPVQVRIVQGKETPHFMAMFGGCMVIHEGGKKSGFANSKQVDSLVESRDSYLLHVRGSAQSNTKAIEVPKQASSLNSNDAFVLVTKTVTYLWVGKGSTGDEREAARRIASSATREPNLVFEGMEKPDFWNAIGGKQEYANEKRLQEDVPDRTPRLFYCSNASGRFVAEELVDFTQDDLVPDDVLVLDSGDAIFVWIGEGANRQEKQNTLILAEEYLRTDPKGRDISTPIIRILQGHEPINFTGFFGVWDYDLWIHQHAEGKICQAVSADKHHVLVDKTNVVGDNMRSTGATNAKYPISVLRVTEPDELPDGVDPTNKESFIDDKDFNDVFGMSYDRFTVLSPWKKAALKKSAGIF